MHIDGSVYPDLESPPQSLDSPEARADYVHRICSAWDYGVPPTPETFELFSTWKDVFDRFPNVTSPAYHAMRLWFHWDPVAVPRGLHAAMPRYVEYDRVEGRGDDPCAEWF
jgi:hypothetical protein